MTPCAGFINLFHKPVHITELGVGECATWSWLRSRKKCREFNRSWLGKKAQRIGVWFSPPLSGEWYVAFGNIISEDHLKIWRSTSGNKWLFKSTHIQTHRQNTCHSSLSFYVTSVNLKQYLWNKAKSDRSPCIMGVATAPSWSSGNIIYWRGSAVQWVSPAASRHGFEPQLCFTRREPLDSCYQCCLSILLMDMGISVLLAELGYWIE